MQLTGVQPVAAAMPDALEGWPAFHRAIALGLSGLRAEASRLLTGLGHPSDPHPWEAERARVCLDLQRRLVNPIEFQDAIRGLIQTQRRALRLPEVAVWDDAHVEKSI